MSSLGSAPNIYSLSIDYQKVTVYLALYENLGYPPYCQVKVGSNKYRGMLVRLAKDPEAGLGGEGQASEKGLDDRFN